MTARDRTNTTSRRPLPRHSRRLRSSGFSLLEILLAVLVLALGLLGLAAVFPVVITQQRTAVEITTGGVAASAVPDVLRSNQLIDWRFLASDRFFGSADRSATPMCPVNDDQFEPSYLWEADWDWGGGAAGFNDQTGEISYNPRAVINVSNPDRCELFSEREEMDLNSSAGLLFPTGAYFVPATARMSPQPYSGGTNDTAAPKRGQPQFVFDFVPRRVGPQSIEIAGFVRRIDNIRVPENTVLSDLLTNQEPAPSRFDRYIPVAFDSAPNRLLPTRDGLGNARQVYSRVCSLAAELDPTQQGHYNRDVITVTPGDADPSGVSEPSVAPGGADPRGILKLVAQPGQKLIDNLGTVRTVTEVISLRNNEAVLRVEPAYPESATTANLQSPAGPGQRGSVLLQVLFTPEIPIRAFVERVYP